MRYSVFVQQQNQEDTFLQSSFDLSSVKRPKNDLNRWLSEMNIHVADQATAKFVITADGKPCYERYFLGAASKSWRAIG